MNPSQKLYDIAFSCIGKHLSLDESVPANFGCAEAVSYILLKYGTVMPDRGIPGTDALNTFCAEHYTEVPTPDVGDIIISITQGTNHGHTGIVGKHAIMSNDSQTGLWQPWWSLPAWIEFYSVQKKLSTKYYRVS